MNILITGGAGFIGTNIIKRLVGDENLTVISIDNYHTGLRDNHQSDAIYYDKDLSTGINYDTYKPDFVFHMAAIARIQPSFKNPMGYFHANAVATLKLTDYCAKNEIPLIYAGSSSKHSGRYKNPYTFSKDVGEDIIKLYQEHYFLKANIVRFYNVYGPNQLVEGGYTTLIGRWLNNIKTNTPSVIYGDGEQRRDFTHVDDIVDALIAMYEQRKFGYEFELGRGKNYSVNEIAKMMNITPTYEPAKPGEARNTLNTDTTANEILGWEPKRNIEDYIKTVI